MKTEIKITVMQLAFVAALFAMCHFLGGCALERADPAARSNRAVYTITVTAHGDGSTASAYISDGLMATADGEGSITQPSTLTTEQSPDITVPGDALTAGIQAVGNLAGKAIDAHAAAKNAEAAKSAEAASAECPGGNCAPGSCPGGNCQE